MKCDNITIDAVLEQVRFDASGLVPVIAQEARNGEVLMLAWMSREAIAETLATGKVCYWSRSRKTLWRKGETSGHTQTLVSFHVDCDGDSILIKIDQTGPACHTNRKSCFYYRAEKGGLVITSEPEE